MSDSDGSVGSDIGEEFQVDKVLDKRVTNGVTEYLVGWKDFGEEDNTWEQEEGLLPGCAELIAKYERENKKRTPGKRPAAVGSSTESNGTRVSERGAAAKNKKTETQSGIGSSLRNGSITNPPDDEKSAFDQGYEPERIIGCTDSSGELQFLMKWKDVEETDFVPATQANVKVPQLVIQFYESRIDWFTKDDDDEEDDNKNE